MVCVLVETAGLALLGLASSVIPAAVGAGLVGFGYALVFPGLGVEAAAAIAESRGLAMGAIRLVLTSLSAFQPRRCVWAENVGLSAAFSLAPCRYRVPEW